MSELSPAVASWHDQLDGRRSRVARPVGRGAALVSRRQFIRRGFWTGLGLAAIGSLGAAVDYLYPRRVRGFGGPVAAGRLEDYPRGGDPVKVQAGSFWLIHLDGDDADAAGRSGLLALWQRCPHLGCSVPWLPQFSFEGRAGWFRCPCHQSTYTRAGVRVYGPAPRSMDTMLVEVDEEGRVTVQTGTIAHGGPDNPTRVLEV